MVVNNRIWVVVAVILMIAIVVMGWFLGVSPRLGEVAANEVQRQGVLAQNQLYEAELTRLKKEDAKLGEYKAKLAGLQKQLPPENDLSTFLGELHQLEGVSGVVLTNFGAADALPFTLEPGAVAAGQAADAVVPPTQTLDSNEFVFIEVTLTVAGNQAQILDFVEALQTGTRRYLVTSLQINTEDAVAYVGKITGYVYVLIDPTKPAEPDDGTVTPTPIPTPTPTTSAGPSGSPSPSLSPSPSATP
jgi:hypothetical protein